MDWLVSLLGGVVSQAVSAYFWAKVAASAVTLGLAIVGLLVVLALIWLTAKQPKAGLIFVGILVVVGLYIAPKSTKTPLNACPIPFEGQTEVTGTWKAPESGWSRYWTNRHIPKEWQPYEALVRVRIGQNDLYVVLRKGQVHVVGENLNVRAVEPLTGSN